MCFGASFESVGGACNDAQVGSRTKGSDFGPDFWRLPLAALAEELWRACEENLPPMKESELELVRSVADPRISNLGHFRCSSKGFDNLNSSSFTLVKRVSGGNNGDIFKYRWHQSQEETCVAVKKLRNRALLQHENTETDERHIHTNPGKFLCLSNEDALTEIGVLMYLSRQQDVPLYLLKMHGVFADKLFTWLVTEFAEGGELFDVAASGNVTEKQTQQYTWQMIQACDYLHRHHIGHRDISLENVLLKDGNVRLMDFGMAVRSHSSSGTPLRFFREVGKTFYRAPECYVPTYEEAEVMAPIGSQPGDVIMAPAHPNFLCEFRLRDSMLPGQTCLADVWGYGALPADVFALGICMFILAFQCPAWECARLSNRFFAHYYKCEGDRLDSLRQLFGTAKVLSPEAMHMLSDMLQVDPSKRPSTSTCLDHPWFAELAKQHPVSTH